MLNATDMDGASAVRWGLLDEAVEPPTLDAAIDREIAALLRCAPGAVADCKRLIEFVSSHNTNENIAYTANQLADRWGSAELAEGIVEALFNKAVQSASTRWRRTSTSSWIPSGTARPTWIS